MGLLLLVLPAVAGAADNGSDLTSSGFGLCALAAFVFAYGLVIAEEMTELRKSIPVLIAAGIVWMLVAAAWSGIPGKDAGEALRENLLEYAELLLFLLAAMTYVNTMQERNVFAALRGWLIARGLSLRALFWITGLMAFWLSPVLDNLTTALVMGAVVIALGGGNRRFVVPACINIVVAANAGGAFSPFGDITTLMVWQKGVVRFGEFFALLLPSLVNWLVPAVCMSFAIPKGKPAAEAAPVHLKHGAGLVVVLFAVTIAGTVLLHQFLHLPPFIGMMTGLGLLLVAGHRIRHRELFDFAAMVPEALPEGFKPAMRPFDIFISMKRVEWDTLMFFYGVVLCIGGLGALGYLHLLSQNSYSGLGPTVTNVLVGVASAIVDNIPIMYAVLNVQPDMSHGQWLLVTLTAGVGGSLLSIGSAAGVALMGQARGVYTFASHLKWSWAIALGYVASIAVHFAVNAAHFAQ
ncbi:MAG: sodium:proton antiporter NhaD [Gammaproteobacteria bacterium]